MAPERLMHCPFCGETELLGVVQAEEMKNRANTWTMQVRCATCFTLGPTASASFPSTAHTAAIQNWNDRISIQEDTALRVAARLTSN